MSKLRIGFLTRSFKPQTRSSVPLVMQALVEAGAIVDVVHPIAGMADLARLRIEHDLYVLRQMSALALSIAGVLHAQGAAIVNPYPVTITLLDKIVTCRILQRAGVPTPDTYLVSHQSHLAPLLDAGPLIVKPIRGSDGYGVRVVRGASELEDRAAGKEPVFAQRYIQPRGSELKMFVIGGRVFGVRRDVQLDAKERLPGDPFTPTPELRRTVLRCGEAFGIDLYGVDIIERDGVPYVVDMNSIPGFKGVPDGPLHVARYLYLAAERAARGERLFESAVPREASAGGVR